MLLLGDRTLRDAAESIRQGDVDYCAKEVLRCIGPGTVEIRGRRVLSPVERIV